MFKRPWGGNNHSHIKPVFIFSDAEHFLFYVYFICFGCFLFFLGSHVFLVNRYREIFYNKKMFLLRFKFIITNASLHPWSKESTPEHPGVIDASGSEDEARMWLWVTPVRWRWERGGFHKGMSEGEIDGRALTFKPCRVEADWLQEGRHDADWTQMSVQVLLRFAKSHLIKPQDFSNNVLCWEETKV